MTGQEWLSFLGEILAYCEYDVVILDLSGQVDELFQILGACHKIYMPVQEDRISAAKTAQFYKLAGMLEMEGLEEKIIRLHLPNQPLSKEGGDLTQQLVWGEMGGFVRKLLWEEEHGNEQQ